MKVEFVADTGRVHYRADAADAAHIARIEALGNFSRREVPDLEAQPGDTCRCNGCGSPCRPGQVTRGNMLGEPLCAPCHQAMDDGVADRLAAFYRDHPHLR